MLNVQTVTTNKREEAFVVRDENRLSINIKRATSVNSSKKQLLSLILC